MIALILYVLLAVAFLVIAACLVVWVIQREPAGHGQHATRRTLTIEYEDLECFQPANLPGPVTSALGEAGVRGVGEHHHRDWTPRAIDAHRDGLAPWIEIALANAQPDETAVDTRLGDDTRDAWQTGTADDPFEGYGSAEGWVRALFAGKVQVAA